MASLLMFTVLKKLHFRTVCRRRSCRYQVVPPVGLAAGALAAVAAVADLAHGLAADPAAGCRATASCR